MDRTISGAITPSQSVPGIVGNEEVLRVPQNFKAAASLTDGLVSHSGHSLPRSCASAEMQLVYSTAPTDWATGHLFFGGGYPSAKMQSVYSIAPHPSRLGR